MPSPVAAEDILDSHLHLIDRSRVSYPWLAGKAALNRDWSLATYAEEARKLGVIRAIHMEVDVAEADIEAETAMIEGLAAAGTFPIAGIIAACRPERPDFSGQIERALARPLVVGFRRILHEVPNEVSQAPLFRENIRRLGPVGRPFDIVMRADQLKLAMQLVDSAPEVRFVLDHCGVPDIAGGAWDPWASDLKELARRPNLCAKLSGIVAYAGAGWSLAELSRWALHVVDCFGPDRIAWGGDWPVATLGGGLSTWVAASRAILAGLSAGQRARIWRGTAGEIWGISDR
jgi:predicted TIM-barrel fold metal-dependent hydrolase